LKSYEEDLILDRHPTDLNCYIDAERRNRFIASRIKKLDTSYVWVLCKKQRLKPVTRPVKLAFYRYVHSRKDPDNVAFKMAILAGLVAAGVLPDASLKDSLCTQHPALNTNLPYNSHMRRQYSQRSPDRLSLIAWLATNTSGVPRAQARRVITLGLILGLLLGFSGVVRMLLHAGELSLLGALGGGVGGGIGGVFVGLVSGTLAGGLLGGLLYRVRGLGTALGLTMGVIAGGIGGAIGGLIGRLGG
jgi:hypothetical protein